jgi:hypothetical protein
MISGRDAFSKLHEALTGARRDEDRLVAMLNSATEEAARLRAEQAEAFRALARIRLDELSGKEVQGALDAAEDAALTLLDRRRKELEVAARRRRSLLDEIAEAQSARNAALAAVEAALEKVDDLREQTQARLENDEEWVAQRRALTLAKQVAEAAAEKAARSEAEKAEKKRPYEADALFMYLWRRGFGTPAYRAFPLARFLDGRVARLIGYLEARPNYFMLNEIPLRLREHAERLGEEAEEAAAKLAAIERRALEADGILPLEAALAEAENRAAETERHIASKEEELARLEAEEHAALAAGTDPVMREALDLVAGSLAREDLHDLHRKALETPTPEDEKIVARLKDLRTKIVRVDSQIEETRKAALEIAGKREELERSSKDFRRKGYDDPFGEFVNERVIVQVIAGILQGLLSSRDLEKVLRDGFQRRPPRTRGGFGGGIKLPGGGPWGAGRKMGGSWGGGGLRTGGSMRGGGFKTGGKF